jgi:hypothetical protein
MMSNQELNERITRAMLADAEENPTLAVELASRGQEAVTRAMEQDVLTVLRGDPGQALFPHLRGTIMDIIGLAKSEIWADTGKYLGADATGGDSTLNFIGGLASALIGAGATVYGAITARNIAQTNLQAQQQIIAANQATQASAQQAAMAASQQPSFSTASMFGGGMGTFLLLGVAGAVIYVISTQIGKKSGRGR